MESRRAWKSFGSGIRVNGKGNAICRRHPPTAVERGAFIATAPRPAAASEPLWHHLVVLGIDGVGRPHRHFLGVAEVDDLQIGVVLLVHG